MEVQKFTDPKRLYDEQFEEYAHFSGNSFTWLYIEKPGFDKYIPDFYRRGIKVLDVGCGTGRVIEHLNSRGVPKKNIVGVDISHKQLQTAKENVCKTMVFQGSLEQIGLSPESFNLVTSNMVFHHVDKGVLFQAFDNIYRILKPNGRFFFVTTDPDHSEEGRNPSNTNSWTFMKSPWKTQIPFFNHDPHELLLDTVYYTGFDLEAGWPLKVSKKGMINMKKYTKYSSKPSRIAVRLTKVSEKEKRNRIDNIGKDIPSLTG